MLIDNEQNSEDPKLYQWIENHVKAGRMDIATGYFTIGALSWLSKTANKHVERFRFVIGDIVSRGEQEIRGMDLLNEDLTLQNIFQLPNAARAAVDFLRQDKVQAKTLEPNFCHAKAFLYKAAHSRPEKGDKDDFFITGSSNLTEAGIGLNPSSNVELNLEGQGTDGDYDLLLKWFQSLWERKEAHKEKTIQDSSGGSRKVNFKSYLIAEISKVFRSYSPLDIYYKILFELFGERILEADLDPDFRNKMGRLENTVVYRTLYEFQQKGVLSLIQMMQKYNGAILADAVGLGKTWQALAVMKFFEMEGHEVILLCPKKLDHNWGRYRKRANSRFEADQLDFVIRYHTDLQDKRLERDNLKIKDYFQSDKPKLLVIDESHNLRNSKSNRYKFLVSTLLKKNADIKVLLLSATPINNSLNDIRNQFKLMVKDSPHGFARTLDIRNLDHEFRKATRAFKEWKEDPERSMGSFLKMLPDPFFRLTDSLVVARTRKMIQGQANSLHFPKKAKPENVFVSPKHIGNFESFDELVDSFPKRLSAYMPSWYVEQEKNTPVLEDEQSRDFFLVKMMYILMVKRLESSWYSFRETVVKILARHQESLDLVKQYEGSKKDLGQKESGIASLFEEEEEPDWDEFEIGKKRKVKLSDIEAAGHLGRYKKHLKDDVAALTTLKVNLDLFAEGLEQASSRGKSKHRVDDKVEALLVKIREKQARGANGGNRKVIVFTVYKDTAEYLYNRLKDAGLGVVALVSSQVARSSDSKAEVKNFEEILERFAPYTKLCKEKEWKGYAPPKDALPKEEFAHWKTWVAEEDPETLSLLQQPIDILIATDVLSEGQNLQDCDFVINYDIHWNPVRIIQRMGRIDRLGSPNEVIFGMNFWPSENINRYLDLQDRIEDRMAQMTLAGSEIDKRMTEGIQRKSQDDKLEREQLEKMIRQMETSWEDIEVSEEIFGFDDLSLEGFRQDLAAQLRAQKDYYDEMPRGVYSGCLKLPAHCPEEGILALTAYPRRPPRVKKHSYRSYELLYLDMEGKRVMVNQQEILRALAMHKDLPREVPEGLDQGDPILLGKLSKALRTWLREQVVQADEEEESQVEGPKVKMGAAGLDLLRKLQEGDAKAFEQVAKGEPIADRYQPSKYDLLAWIFVQ